LLRKTKLLCRGVHNLPDLSIRQLEYLIAVAEENTWADASDAVGVTPSALSQGLAELERRVGVPLFDRVGRRRMLHPNAEILLDHARQVISLTSDLAKWSDRMRNADEGTIRIGMIDIAAVNYFQGVLKDFRNDHPSLNFHLKVSPSRPLVEALQGGQLDLIVCIEPEEKIKGIEIEPLLTETLSIYKPGGGPLGPPSEWGPWVLFPESSNTRKIISAALKERGSSVNVVADSPQPEVLKEMVNLGIGWTVLPNVQAEAGPRPLIPSSILGTRNLIVASRKNAAQSPAIISLLEALKEQLD
jgi:DNA-binding transcriptional LysR family regulator